MSAQTQVQERRHQYAIENALDNKSKKLWKKMQPRERAKLFRALEDFCVNGIQSTYYQGGYVSIQLGYLKIKGHGYRMIITHDDTIELPHHEGVVYVKAIVPRKQLQQWIDNHR